MDTSIVKSPNKQMKNPPAKNPRRTRSSQFPSKHTENVVLTNTTTTAARGRGGGIFFGPLPGTPPPSSVYWRSYPPTTLPHHQPPPPLLPLPLPITNTHFYSLPSYLNPNITGTKLVSPSPPPKTTKKAAPKKSTKKPTKMDDSKALVSSETSLSGPDPNYDDFLAISPPPPSSLPLPKFFLRPKRSLITCTAEAGGVDTGATNNLRGMLRLS